MHSMNVASDWVSKGFTHCVFFQDTNGLGFHTLAASLGVSSSLGLVMNSIAIPRKAKQAVGSICKLTNSETGEVRTINVEYNQLDPLLRATVNEEGDVNDEESGFSPFPGNINQLIFRLKEYQSNLKVTNGVMAEFVNPKYKDAEKTVFKKNTRLECMMQDYPMVLKGPDAKKVGFTSVVADMCFSPVKNAVADGAQAQKKGTHPAVAFSGESDQYNALAKIMRSIGCDLEEGEMKTFQNITCRAGPKVVVSPYVCSQPMDYKEVFPSPKDVKVSGRSALVIKGKGSLVVKSLKLDGALTIDTGGDSGVTMTLEDVEVSNKGWTEKKAAGGAPEWVKMRGYTIEKTETCVISSDGKGGYTVEGDGLVKKEEEKRVEEQQQKKSNKEEKEEEEDPVVEIIKVESPAPAPAAPAPAPVEAKEETAAVASKDSAEKAAASEKRRSDENEASNECGCIIM